MDKIELSKNEQKELFVEYFRLIFEQNVSYLLTRTSSFEYNQESSSYKYFYKCKRYQISCFNRYKSRDKSFYKSLIFLDGLLDVFQGYEGDLFGKYKNLKFKILNLYLIEKERMKSIENKNFFNEVLFTYLDKHPRKMFYGQAMLNFVSDSFPERNASFEELLKNVYENIYNNIYSKKVINYMYPIIQFYICRNGLQKEFLDSGKISNEIVTDDVVNFSEKIIQFYDSLNQQEREEIDNRLSEVSKINNSFKGAYKINQQKINKIIRIFNSKEILKSDINDLFKQDSENECISNKVVAEVQNNNEVVSEVQDNNEAFLEVQNNNEVGNVVNECKNMYLSNSEIENEIRQILKSLNYSDKEDLIKKLEQLKNLIFELDNCNQFYRQRDELLDETSFSDDDKKKKLLNFIERYSN